jgi:hypothetical protein
VISGNGYKTLDEHPDKPWPEMVACEVEAMERTLADTCRAGLGGAGLRSGGHGRGQPGPPGLARAWGGGEFGLPGP